MKRTDKLGFALALLANVLATVFLWAALSKIADLSAFHSALERTGLVPMWGLPAIDILIPATELVLAFSLFGLRPNRAALYVGVVLLAGFLGFQIYTAIQVGWLGTVEAGCPCFVVANVNRPMAQIYLVARNGLLLALALGAVWLHRRADNAAQGTNLSAS